MIMRKFIYVLCSFLFFGSVFAQPNWDFKQLSLVYGRVFFYENPKIHTFEMTFHRGTKRGAAFPLYFSTGFNFYSSYQYREYGAKSLFNLIIMSFGVSRNYRMFPYVFYQYNYKKYRIEPLQPDKVIPRVGFGFSGISIQRERFNVRPDFQFG